MTPSGPTADHPPRERELRLTVESLRAEIRMLSAEADRLRRSLDEASRARELAVGHLRAIRQSRSWRLTRPIRWVKRVVEHG